MKRFAALLLSSILASWLLVSCAGFGEPPAPAVQGPYEKLADAPVGLSVVNAATKKYATWGPLVEACTYTDFYVSTVNGKAEGMLQYGFSVWVPKGKICKRKIEEFVALARQCAQPNFPVASKRSRSSEQPSPYRLLGTAIGGDAAREFEQSHFPSTGIFRHFDDCNVAFIDN
jgi:hypothetical protein